jgi:hypothetical protein
MAKDNKKKIKALFLAVVSILFIIVLMHNVFAIGITPGRTTLNFEPSMQKEIEFKIINNEHKAMRVLFSATGELAGYITLKTPSAIVDFSTADKEKTFTYSVALPEKLTPAGEHELRISATELPPEGTETGVQIGTIVTVTSQLLVKVPYPYKYTQISLTADKFDTNKTAGFYVEVENLGEQDLVGMQATIEILSATNQKIAIIKTDSKTITANTKAELVARWKADVNPGNYRAIATLAYDEGKLATAEKIFAVGSMLVDVVDVSVGNFRLGDIAKFDITVENKWSEEIKDVYANLQIQDASNNSIANVKTPSINMPPLSRSVLNAYWDTAGVKEGTYSGKMFLNFANQVVEKELKTEITLSSIKVEILGVGVTAKATAAETGRQNIMFILVVLLVLINIAWFVYFKRKNKK